MGFKSMLAVAAGLGLLGFGIWRFTSGQMVNGVVVGLVGAVLLFRGASGTVRRGL